MSDIRNRLNKYINNTSNNNIRNRLNNYINSSNQEINFNEEKEDKSLLKTASAGLQYLGQGVIKGLEGVFVDTPLIIAAGTKKLFGDEEGAKGLMEASDVSLTNMLINKAAGKESNPYKNNNQNLWNKEVDKNSYIKEDNLGGKIISGVGEMLPTIAIGGSLAGGLKAKQIGSNVLLGTGAFSSGTNEAYRESGNLGKSMLYGLGNAGTEILTEKISGGIPGLKQIGGTTKKEIAKNYLKSALGEGVEEVISSLVNPVLQTTYKGSEALNQYGTSDYWKGVLESGIVGSAVGGILDAPNTISNVKNTSNTNITQNTPKTVYDLVQQEQNSQNSVNLPIVDNSGNRVNSNINVRNDYKSSSFDDDMRKFESGNYTTNDMLTILDNIPEYFYNLGYNTDSPLVINMKKLQAIMSDKKVVKEGLNQHGITREIIEQLPYAISNPLNVIKNPNYRNRFVIVTELSDKYGDIVIVPIEIDVNGKQNRIVSIYGKEQYDGNDNPNIKGYMEQNIKNIVYDIDNDIQKKSRPLDAPIALRDNSFNNNISQSNNNVKSDISIKQSMQNQSNNTQKIPTQEDIKKMELKDTNLPTRKTLNPTEISNLTKEDANTTPILPNVNVSTGNGKSKFASNIKNKTNMLNEDSKNAILSDNDVNYYREVTNEESLNQAFERLNTNGKSEVERWFRQDSENANSTDVAEGWILLKQYQDQISKATDLNAKNELNRSMVQVAKKLRDMGTKAGQTVQAFNILNRLTPEGMVYYAQSELDEAFQHMVKNKSQNWINKYKSDFELTPQETQFILDTMKEVSQMQDGYDKRVKLAEIQKLMTDKLPPQKGAGIKAWMRISMLFNPKTQVRNVVGNALIAPVNSFSDLIGSVVDKRLAQSTNVRTTGTTSLKNYGKGFKKGLFESYNDFKKGINTRNIEGNRFEISQGRSFNNKTKIGNALNRVDNLLSFMLDAGDRGFYEASFVNSINNQMVLNNTVEVTQDMIDIATSEALQRTWQDNNNYTRFVMNIRKMMNAGKEYGLGDILIPFAKTPANLTKAIVDYSPVGLINSINKGIRFKRSLTNGQFTPQLQHDFVQTLGKATAGTMLYVLGYALAKAGITSGESDDDKDVSNFLKNTLGINSYSIKIGDKSFAYDWAQPLAAPLAITANIVQKDKENQSLVENIISSLDTAGSILLEQSFMDSLNTVFNNNDGVVTGLQEALLELPSRAIPTVFKQIADMVDGTQRTSFEYNKPLETAINKVKAKIPFLSQTLSPSVDTLGRDIQKYGGNNNIFNVFFNPANVSTENISESASEIYRLYKETGDKTIMPRVAPYYINQDGSKITLSASEKAEYQSISGQIIEDNVKDLLDNDIYNAMNDENKTEIINKIVNFSYNKAREEVLNIPMSDEYNKINMYINDGGTPSDYYINKEEIDYSYENPSKYSTITQITTYAKYQNYNVAIKDIKEQYEDSNQRKYSVINYVNGLNLSVPQKAMLIKLNYSSFKDYDNQIIEYINSQNMTIAEKTTILEQLGFTVRNGRVYS